MVALWSTTTECSLGSYKLVMGPQYLSHVPSWIHAWLNIKFSASIKISGSETLARCLLDFICFIGPWFDFTIKPNYPHGPHQSFHHTWPTHSPYEPIPNASVSNLFSGICGPFFSPPPFHSFCFFSKHSTCSTEMQHYASSWIIRAFSSYEDKEKGT